MQTFYQHFSFQKHRIELKIWFGFIQFTIQFSQALLKAVDINIIGSEAYFKELVQLEIIIRVLRFEPALNWNRFWAVRRRGSNFLNSGSGSDKIERTAFLKI